MLQTLLEFVVIMFVCLLVGAGALLGVTVWTVRAVTRRMSRARHLTRTRLVAGSVGLGAARAPGRPAARLRLRLFDELAATSRTLEQLRSPAGLQALSDELRRGAMPLDRELQALGLERNSPAVSARVAALRPHVDEIARTAAELRATARELAFLATGDADRSAIEVSDQLVGLRHGLAEVRAIRARAGL
ncbi:hypothetical protein M6D93_19240 [Jatrophihabitans telluris]|uniref:Uncharacterized protein n=1 Tax=Jatrophihabitans telluris TaxID=2038343 RepID=A0ABY4QZ52_9ACTN|nr:hypothetical protein [Jatrophihabitans telluris]UQX88392.1 hypothetical protein M6D93_19240 [Jatrophihabitans telluris]